jgi:hypothetical protein
MIAQNLPFLLLHHVFLTLPPTFNQRRLDDRKASEAVMTMRSVGGETDILKKAAAYFAKEST